MNESLILISFIGITGACIGSFLNVCIVRMPLEKSIVNPPSHCPQCKKSIAWYDNIPIISYILIAGRCRHCKKRIPLRYALVEFLTAAAFIGFYFHFGLDIVIVPYLFMLSCFIVATFVDFEHRLIPDEISLGGLVAGLLFSIFITNLHDVSSQTLLIGRAFMRIIVVVILIEHILGVIIYRLKNNKNPPKEDEEDGAIDYWLIGIIFFAIGYDLFIDLGLSKLSGTSMEGLIPYLKSFDASVIGFMIGGGSIYAMGMLGDFLFKKESMGGGDVKLMAMIGAFMGWKLAILSFFIAPFFGAIYGVVEKIRTKDTAIAYGPFLVAGALISLFWGDVIIHWIMNGYGLR